MKTVLEKFLVICVNYHNDAETVNYVEQVLNETIGLKAFVIIVDNSVPANKKSPLIKLDLLHQNVKVIQLGTNKGYFGGAQKGLEIYLKDNSLPDWIIVSNTDMEFCTKYFFEDFNRLCKTIPNLGVVAPRITSKVSGKDQNPYMMYRPKVYMMRLYKYVYNNRVYFSMFLILSFFKRLLYKNVKERPGGLYKKDVYAPHGAFLIFHKRYFEKGGGLNYPVFLFGEEIFVAETCRNLGLKIVHETRVDIVHKEHATIGNVSKNRRYHAESATYCADTFFSSK